MKVYKNLMECSIAFSNYINFDDISFLDSVNNKDSFYHFLIGHITLFLPIIIEKYFVNLNEDDILEVLSYFSGNTQKQKKKKLLSLKVHLCHSDYELDLDGDEKYLVFDSTKVKIDDLFLFCEDIFFRIMMRGNAKFRIDGNARIEKALYNNMSIILNYLKGNYYFPLFSVERDDLKITAAFCNFFSLYYYPLEKYLGPNIRNIKNKFRESDIPLINLLEEISCGEKINFSSFNFDFFAEDNVKDTVSYDEMISQTKSEYLDLLNQFESSLGIKKDFKIVDDVSKTYLLSTHSTIKENPTLSILKGSSLILLEHNSEAFSLTMAKQKIKSISEFETFTDLDVFQRNFNIVHFIRNAFSHGSVQIVADGSISFVDVDKNKEKTEIIVSYSDFMKFFSFENKAILNNFVVSNSVSETRRVSR